MTYLSDILDVGELSRQVAEGYIGAVRSRGGDLVLYNYTARATYARVWTPETRQCRGLIVEQATGLVVCRPFDKFFNVDEVAEARLDALLALPGRPTLTEKLDGSMVAIWAHGGRISCTTRGSFTSAQAAAAQAWLAQHAPEVQYLPAGLTLIGEWCSPDNRVVLRYDRPELRLIGARFTSGVDFDHPALVELGAEFGLPVVTAPADDLIEAMAARERLAGVEGWVARWPGGYRVKIKTAEYLRLHRLISAYSPERLRESLLDDTITNYLEQLPEELRAEAEGHLAAIQARIAARVARANASYHTLAPLLAEGRKAFALRVQLQPLDLRPLLFALADGKPIDKLVLRSLNLSDLIPQEATP